MCLKIQPIGAIPTTTADVARAAFPKGNLYLKLRDELGIWFNDADFARLYSTTGQPAAAPWRLALITILQFRENLADRQAAEAVRARIDWKYLLGLELTDAGFDFSVLSEFRGRLIGGELEALLLDRLLERCRELGLLKARGRQRTDATHVLGVLRELNRLALLGETLRAALNEIARVEPQWLQQRVPADWYKRYSRPVENNRLPQSESKRQAYAQTVGENGFALLDWLAAPGTPFELATLKPVEVLRRVWQRHFIIHEDPTPPATNPSLRLKTKEELADDTDRMESPYEMEARFRSKNDHHWKGYLVHWSETCDADTPHLITHAKTTLANVHESSCTEAIHQEMAEKNVLPNEHLVDTAYIDAQLLVQSQSDHQVTLVGPTHQNSSWQSKIDGGYDITKFTLDWDIQQAICPQGKRAASWKERPDARGELATFILFSKTDCLNCDARERCTRAKFQGRLLHLPARQQYEALQTARERMDSEEGQQLYHKRAGIEGTLSQGVRAYGLRQSRYRGLAKTHLQHIASAAAVNLDRLGSWLMGNRPETTRISHFAALAP
jgi:transposase